MIVVVLIAFFNMPNHCKAINCTGVGLNGEKVGFFQFLFKKAPNLVQYCVNFVSRENLQPVPDRKGQGLCSKHFEQKYLRIQSDRFFCDGILTQFQRSKLLVVMHLSRVSEHLLFHEKIQPTELLAQMRLISSMNLIK